MHKHFDTIYLKEFVIFQTLWSIVLQIIEYLQNIQRRN